MSDRDHLGELSSAVACYLNTVAAIGDSLAASCPEIGAPYRQRLQRLRTRLQFDTTRESVKESAETVQHELKDWSATVSTYLHKQHLELWAGIEGLQEIIQSLVRSQELYVSKMEQFAIQMETANRPVATQTAELRCHAESMNRDNSFLLARMRDQLASLDSRLAEFHTTDPSTGLLNRREMNRHIEARTASETTFTLLRFELAGAVGEDLMRQAAAKLGTQFRHQDLVARWGEREFLVLFLGQEQLARARADQALPKLIGPYDVGGQSIHISVELSVRQQELAVV